MSPEFDEATRAEVKRLMENDPKELEESFYRNLEFGTGGLRGIMGVGTNRMNKYVVAMATQGLANYMKMNFKELKQISVAISYDCRNNSQLFAKITAEVFAANGFKVYLVDALRPTPELSFAIRHYKCQGGVMVTASHNPKEYNGYKAYWEDGAQITAPHDVNIINEVLKITSLSQVKFHGNEENIELVGKELDEAYLSSLETLHLTPEAVAAHNDIKIVYTPLHGTGVKLVPMALERMGFKNIYGVEAQNVNDGDFPTVKSPNPEESSALEMAVARANEVGADVVMATDPDADRLGVYCKDTKTGEYVSFTGNMSGMLIAEYILRERTATNTMPENPALVETIVTTDMAKVIAKDYGVKLIEVLTGFKFIGEQIKIFDETGCNNYVFGLEESYGCLAGTYARDKDACVAVMMLCEVASYYKAQGKTLWDAMVDMYEKYGYFKEGLETLTLKGTDGAEQILKIMTDMRNNPPKELGGYKVLAVRDYKEDTRKDLVTGEVTKTGLPNSNVLYYELEDNAWCCVRPSGTEPKIKFYFGVKGTSIKDSEEKLEAVKNDMLKAAKAE